MAERNDEYGESLKAEEGVLLLDDNDFGAMWLNSATSFSLVTEPPQCSLSLEHLLVAQSPQTPFKEDSSSVLQRVAEALASEEAVPVLEALKHLSDSLHALERIAEELLPSPETSFGGDELHCLLVGAQVEDNSAVEAAGLPLPSVDAKQTGLSDLWRQVSICAAAVGAQQEESRALQRLSLAELEPKAVTAKWTLQLEEVSRQQETSEAMKLRTEPPLHRQSVGKDFLWSSATTTAPPSANELCSWPAAP